MVSIVWLLLLWFAFPAEVIGVALLCVPSLCGVQDIKAPAHHFASFNGSRESLNLHGMLGISIPSCARVEVKRALVGAPRFEFDNPMLSNLLVLRVVVNMLALRVINSSNLWSVDLSVPRIAVNVKWSAGTLIDFFSLIETDFVDVSISLKVMTIGEDGHSLDGPIKKLLGIWGWARWNSPNIVSKLLGNSLKSLLGHYLANSCDIFWHIKIIILIIYSQWRIIILNFTKFKMGNKLLVQNLTENQI